MTTLTVTWARVADLRYPPSHRTDPAGFAVWQAWRTHQGDQTETATRRLMTLPDDARALFLEAFAAFDAGALPRGPEVPAWERAA